MIFTLIFLLIIAGVIIYKLNDNVNDDKLIKSNYSWKEEIQTLQRLIKNLENQEEKVLSERQIANGVKYNHQEIISYTERIIKLQQYISNNEQYLKEKGKL